MIHIIDPRYSQPLPHLVPSRVPRTNSYLTDLQLHSALVVAIREKTGRYRVLKVSRLHQLPKAPITRRRLDRIVAETMDRA